MTTAILPSNTRLYTAQPMANTFHADWVKSAARHGGGTYLLLKQHRYGSARFIILSGSGSPEGYPSVGKRINVHHDQTLRQLGEWEVIAKIEHDRVGELPIKSAMLYVYK